MQYETPLRTKITIRSDFPTAVSSTRHGANMDTIGFNIEFIAKRRPQLAVDLLRLKKEADRLTEGDPFAPDEDFLAAQAAMRRLILSD